MAGHADEIFVGVWMCWILFRSCDSDCGHVIMICVQSHDHSGDGDVSLDTSLGYQFPKQNQDG